LATTNGSVEISNYTDAQTISIHRVIGKIKSSSKIILDIINLETVEKSLNEIFYHTETELKTNNLYHTLRHEITKSFD